MEQEAFKGKHALTEMASDINVSLRATQFIAVAICGYAEDSTVC